MELGEDVRRPAGRSRRWQDLRIRLVAIARALSVDSGFVPTDQAGVDRLHAYRVLAHAEVEDFVEKLAGTAVDVTEAQLNNGVATHAGHHLLVSWASVRVTKDSLRARYPHFSRADAVACVTTDRAAYNAALAAHRNAIQTNHGLKEANVRRLLLPVGYRESFFDPGLLDKLTDFGEQRGAVAHSTGVGVTTVPTGSTEITRVAGIMGGLRRLEQILPRLLLPA